MQGIQLPALQETSLKYSLGIYFSINKRPEYFTIFVCENILFKKGKLQQPPPKHQPVTGEACLQRQSPKKSEAQANKLCRIY